MKWRKYLLIILLSPITVLFQIAPAVGAAAIGGIVSIGTSVAGYGKGKKAQKAQKEAQKIQWEEAIRAHEVNIELAKHQAGVDIGDVQREGAQFSRGQMAAMGAAGAEVGSGTPLQNMLATQAGIARDTLNIQKALDIEVEYREGEIEELDKLLNPMKYADWSPSISMKRKKEQNLVG